MICQFIGMQAWVDTDKTGGRNPLVDAAMEIDIFAGAKRNDELDQMRGEKVADRIEDDPRLQKPVAADPRSGTEASNPEGSFEAFMALMGGGVRPAMPGVSEQPEGGGG